MDAPSMVAAIYCVAGACVANFLDNATGDLLREDNRAVRHFMDSLRVATTAFFVATRRPVPVPGPPALGMSSVLAGRPAPRPWLRPVGPLPPPGLSVPAAPAVPPMLWQGAPAAPPLLWQGGPPPWQPFPGRGPWAPPSGLGVPAAVPPVGGEGAGRRPWCGCGACPVRRDLGGLARG
jgi:hypothetical protein